MTVNNEEELIERFVILDTCVVRYWLNNDMKVALRQCLLNAINAKFALAISNITIQEALEASSSDNEQELLDFLDYMRRYEVDVQVLTLAARFGNFYARHDNIRGHANDISLADKIIAATVTITGSLILTADGNDFPRPFFKDVVQVQIEYKRKKKQNTIMLQYLEPSYAAINDFLPSVLPKDKKKSQSEEVKEVEAAAVGS